MKPYTYLIKHKPTGKVYYGFRAANKVDPEQDLWHTYFTSSLKVQQLIEETGADSFEVEIRKVFETKEQASAWETKVLRRCKVLTDERWINQNIAGYIVPTKESRKKISDFHKDKPKAEEHKEKIRQGNIGKQRPWSAKNLPTDTRGEKNGMFGKHQSEETKQKIGKANKGRTAYNKGVPMSEEQKAKIRATKAANPTKLTAEQKAKISARQTGTKRSEETKDRIRAALKGKPKGPMSEEEKLKRSLANLGKPKPKGMGEKLKSTIAAQKAAGTHYSQIKLTCPHCGTQASKARYNGYHGDKCKRKVS